MSKRFILIFFLPLNLIFDIFLVFFEKNSYFGLLRFIFILIIFLFSLEKNNNIFKYFFPFFIFIGYVTLNIIFSSNPLISLNISLKVISSILAFIIAFNLINILSDFLHVSKGIFIMLSLLIINYIVSNYFNIGYSVYSDSDDFLVGNLRDNWNVFTYTLLCVPFIISIRNIFNKKNYMLIFLSLIVGIILLLSIKRIAIVGLILGLLVYIYYNFEFGKVFKSLTIVSFFIFSFFPFYSEILFSRLVARSDRFEEGSLEEEARYMETIYVWKESLSFESPIQSIFGLEAFNSVGNYASGSFGDRNLHVDYNLIVNTIGLFGLFLYLYLFYKIYYFFNQCIRFVSFGSIIDDNFKGLFYSLLFTQFITSFAGQIYGITFRSIIFFFLGLIFGFYFNSNKGLHKSFYLNENSNNLQR